MEFRELSDDEWELIKPLLPPRARTGRPRADDRLVLNGILYVLMTGCRWMDMPIRYGSHKTAWKRRNSAIMFKELGEKEWGRMVGYGRRWAAETAFSTFKRLYGEYCMAKNMETIAKELAAKAYNMVINLRN